MCQECVTYEVYWPIVAIIVKYGRESLETEEIRGQPVPLDQKEAVVPREHTEHQERLDHR